MGQLRFVPVADMSDGQLHVLQGKRYLVSFSVRDFHCRVFPDDLKQLLFTHDTDVYIVFFKFFPIFQDVYQLVAFSL